MELIQLAVPVLFKGLGMTLTLTAISVAIGFNLGLGLAIMRGSDNSWLSGIARYYSIVFRGTPLLVQIFLIYYGLGQIKFIHEVPALWWVVSEGSRCAVLALALNTAAYTSEILRGGLVSVPAGLVEAAKACGMSRAMRFRRIEFPLAIRQAARLWERTCIDGQRHQFGLNDYRAGNHRLRQTPHEPDFRDFRGFCHRRGAILGAEFGLDWRHSVDRAQINASY